MQTTDVWIYRDQSRLGFDPTSGKDLTGYHVEALDGSIGKIDRRPTTSGASYVIVDTGPWIFGKKVMLPAGVIERVDENEKKVYVNRNKDQIKSAPEYDESMHGSDLPRRARRLLRPRWHRLSRLGERRPLAVFRLTRGSPFPGFLACPSPYGLPLIRGVVANSPRSRGSEHCPVPTSPIPSAER